MPYTGEGIKRLRTSFCNCYSWVMSRRHTPLAAWMRNASPEQRERLAALAGTTVNYLWQIATCRRMPNAALALGIEDGTRAMRTKKLPIVTVRDIATMCALEGLPG